MRAQAGVLHVDRRDVDMDEAAAIVNSITSLNHPGSASWQSPGVFMAQASPSGSDAQRLCVVSGISITFDGRLDNRDDLLLRFRDDLRGASSDDALALAAYRCGGIDGLSGLIGDWSLAIYDSERELAVLASDFAGTRPLYYYPDTGRLLWSTSLKRLTGRVQPCKIDEYYVAGFLSRGGYPDLTPYPGIRSVRPGHAVIFSRGVAVLRSFWRPPTGSTIRYQHEVDYEEHLRDLFRDAVRSRLRTDAPVLIELSGGLDSSSVVCMAKHLAETGPARGRRLVTLSYERSGSRDMPFYKAIEEWSRIESIHLRADGAYLSAFETGDAIPAFWSPLHKRVADEACRIGARTVMTGLLGDAIMANLTDDSAQVSGLLRQGRICTALGQSLAWSKSLRVPVASVLSRNLLWLLPASVLASRPEFFSEAQDSGNKDDSLAPSFRARTGVNHGERFFSQVWCEARPERKKYIQGLVEYLELRSLQPREPLEHLSFTHPYAHRPLVEFMLSIPSSVACGPGEPRRLMRRAFSPFWPQALRGRRSKDSFSSLFLNALRPFVLSLTKDVNRLQVVERGYVDPHSLRSRLARLGRSLDCDATQLYRIVLLELWLRHRGFAQVVPRAS